MMESPGKSFGGAPPTEVFGAPPRSRFPPPTGRPWEGTGVEPLIKGQPQSEGLRARASRRAPAPGARAVSLCGTSSGLRGGFRKSSTHSIIQVCGFVRHATPGGHTRCWLRVRQRDRVALCVRVVGNSKAHPSPKCVWKRGRSIQPSQNLPSNVLSHCNLQAVGRTRLNRAETRLVREQHTRAHPRTGMQRSTKGWSFTFASCWFADAGRRDGAMSGRSGVEREG